MHSSRMRTGRTLTVFRWRPLPENLEEPPENLENHPTPRKIGDPQKFGDTPPEKLEPPRKFGGPPLENLEEPPPNLEEPPWDQTPPL